MLVDSNNDSGIPLRGPRSPVHLGAAAAKHRGRGGQDPLPVLRGPPLRCFADYSSKGGRIYSTLSAG